MRGWESSADRLLRVKFDVELADLLGKFFDRPVDHSVFDDLAYGQRMNA